MTPAFILSMWVRIEMGTNCMDYFQQLIDIDSDLQHQAKSNPQTDANQIHVIDDIDDMGQINGIPGPHQYMTKG